MAARVCLVGLIAGGHSGVPRYAAALARALDSVADSYPDLSLILLTTAAGADAVGPQSLAVKIVAGRSRRVNAGPGRLALEHLALRRERADLFHFFDVTGPVLAPRRPFVATIHDAAVMQGYGLLRNMYKRRLYPWALARARALVAVSKFAKDETLRYFDVDPEKIAVVHSGPGFVAAADGRPAAGTGAGDGPFVVYVGNLGPNKNLPFLVRAFDRADVPARLLLAGRARGGLAETTDAIAAARSRDRIEILSDVSDAELDGLYRSAVAVVLPSTYEGFGFTSLEAMSRGCPVLASDIAALREVSGAGALLLPLGDEEAWAAAIRRVVHDEGLRAELRTRGTETVGRYSWEQTARGVLEVFRRAYRESRVPAR
ncbi:MAG TPA: glycosyltransferase family 1 protein [Gaiellaceae bacterium]|jgi:glycosyltransferase involved in cell wall biosynthesis|nr:glycosyltransferase family 1 protein [Gaiellaceae bacterium]